VLEDLEISQVEQNNEKWRNYEGLLFCIFLMTHTFLQQLAML